MGGFLGALKAAKNVKGKIDQVRSQVKGGRTASMGGASKPTTPSASPVQYPQPAASLDAARSQDRARIAKQYPGWGGEADNNL